MNKKERSKSQNPMRKIYVEKVVLNIGAGGAGEQLDRARTLLEKITGKKPNTTLSKTRNPVFKIRKKEPIGAMVTLRGKQALDIIQKTLYSKKMKLSSRSFDKFGNFSYGVHEYILIPGLKYDPEIGMMGFDVCVTLKRKGERVVRRRIAKSKVGKAHRITKQEGIEFAKSLGIIIE